MPKLIKPILLTITLLIGSIAIAASDKYITMATTTSVESSGLLDYLLPIFEKTHNINIKIIATGTGRAIKLGENGDVDIIMAHAPNKETQFMDAEYGIERQQLMHNYFLIIGRATDPANIANAANASEAFSRIAAQKSPFISRGDNSGTHIKENQIWHAANLLPQGRWYKQVGQSMGKTLHIANELDAYTLIDLGTWLKLKNKVTLKALYIGDKSILNPYSVILINPKKHPQVKYKLAKRLATWLSSKQTKKLISQYKVDSQQLFFIN